jgi:cysteinyl-tRNA synthetase
MLELLEQRAAAKKAKDWARADALRDRIAAAGWKIVDTPKGPRLEKA